MLALALRPFFAVKCLKGVPNKWEADSMDSEGCFKIFYGPWVSGKRLVRLPGAAARIYNWGGKIYAAGGSA